MDTLLIKNALLDGKSVNIYIEGKYIKEIGINKDREANRIIDASNKALIPGFVNGHTHAAMTLFRGFADDMPLTPWLKDKIWPNEAKMTQNDIYWGSKLACLEMIKSGTTTFLDMYPKIKATATAVKEMGLRAVLSGVCFDHFNSQLTEQCKIECERTFRLSEDFCDRITFALGPHAIYTVSGTLLKWLDKFSQENNLLIHLHLAETEEERENALQQFGYTPVRYLYQLGVLSPRLVIAHGLFIDSDEIKMLADYGVKVVHNPASNMKLGSGAEFRFIEMKENGVNVLLGTDGCASSNNLDMIEAMKLASLLGKAWRKNPEAVTAEEIFATATANGASALRLKAGKIAPGYLADLCLVDLKQAAFTPNFNFISNIVYAANGSCIDTVICNGKILMENRHVPGEEEILENASRIAYNLVTR